MLDPDYKAVVGYDETLKVEEEVLVKKVAGKVCPALFNTATSRTAGDLSTATTPQKTVERGGRGTPRGGGRGTGSQSSYKNHGRTTHKGSGYNDRRQDDRGTKPYNKDYNDRRQDDRGTKPYNKGYCKHYDGYKNHKEGRH